MLSDSIRGENLVSADRMSAGSGVGGRGLSKAQVEGRP